MGRLVKCRLCGKEFEHNKTKRLRMLCKERKGESVMWICPDCNMGKKIFTGKG